ncbi:MAG: alkaline phosphatase family protein [Nanoarchaeota archaeon]
MKVICLDAFKYDYLDHTPFLRSLTKKYQHGRLKVPLGFEGGMDSFFRGKKSDIIALFCRSYASPYRWTRYFHFLPRIIIDIKINIQKLLKNHRRFHRTRYIPKKKIQYFDTAVNKIPQQYINFDYRWIGIIDKLGHKYGPNSREIKDALKKLDRQLEKEDFDLIMSDHGMMEVKEYVEVPETDICFIDSTMARYWDRKPEISTNKGRWIKGSEKFGRYIFVANPGVVFLPNYWDGSNKVKGMHGYAPPCSEIDGFYILKREGKKKDLKISDLNRYIRR